MRRHRRAARRKARGRVGRPRKAGQRKPSGDLRILVDGGSPRLLAHRALTIDPTLAAVDLDGLAPMAQARDRRASYPLGVLILRREISSLQHYAGRRYLGLFMAGVRGVGTPSILACLVSLSRGSHGNGFDSPIAELDIKARADYLAARRLLDQARDGVAQVADAVAIYEFCLVDRAQLAKLRLGLDNLVEHFRSADERAAARSAG